MKRMHYKYFIFNPSYFVNIWKIVEMGFVSSPI